MAIVTGAVVIVFGTLTLVLHVETIKVKPTIITACSPPSSAAD
jgi:intracellular septation protein